MSRADEPETPLSRAEADGLALDQQLCFALYSASRAMTKAYGPALDPLGITYPQYLVLLVLWETNDLAVHELGARLYLDSGTLTPMLKRLEAQGLISRERDETDERRVRVQVTAAGRALRRRARAIPPAMVCATGCELDELVKLTTRLRALRAHLSRSVESSSQDA